MAENDQQQLFQALFAQMILSLNEAAMMQMGKIVNPMSGKVERNLGQAQGTIDLLRMLQEKTRGNLGAPEQHLIDQCIMNLQMNFVYEQKQDKPVDASAAENAGAAPVEPPTAEHDPIPENGDGKQE